MSTTRVTICSSVWDEFNWTEAHLVFILLPSKLTALFCAMRAVSDALFILSIPSTSTKRRADDLESFLPRLSVSEVEPVSECCRCYLHREMFASVLGVSSNLMISGSMWFVSDGVADNGGLVICHSFSILYHIACGKRPSLSFPSACQPGVRVCESAGGRRLWQA